MDKNEQVAGVRGDHTVSESQKSLKINKPNDIWATNTGAHRQ